MPHERDCKVMSEVTNRRIDLLSLGLGMAVGAALLTARPSARASSVGRRQRRPHEPRPIILGRHHRLCPPRQT
jgi:hypothetical protein